MYNLERKQDMRGYFISFIGHMATHIVNDLQDMSSPGFTTRHLQFWPSRINLCLSEALSHQGRDSNLIYPYLDTFAYVSFLLALPGRSILPFAHWIAVATTGQAFKRI